jgi:16S rRNA (cytosine967-C5)-methyltransferase
MSAEARICAYAVLRRVFEQGAYADRAFQSEARTLDARDRALAMRLAYGAVQRRGTSDYLIERLAERPLGRLDPAVLASLRLGLYELLYLRGSPDHAVVADAVELAKGGGQNGGGGGEHGQVRGGGRHGQVRGGGGRGQGSGGGHGLVNAVLRRAIREGGSALLDALDEDTPAHAAVKHSHPEWLVRLWWRELGAEQARALMAADNEPSEVALRVNTLVSEPATVASALKEAGVALHVDPQLSEALVLDGPFDLHASPLWRAGALLAQSRAAMLVARVLDPQPGERVLDLCAAPGGKSTHLAALMRDRGEVVAVELGPRRAAGLQRTAARLRASSVRVELADAAQARTHEAPFDRVLVDPPCSGLGTLQARADLRWRVTQESIAELAGIQEAILRAGAAVVRPGGVLVYSTCTISQTENDRQIASFVDRHPDFALVGGAQMTLPHRDNTAGFYIAKLQRS